MKGMLFASLARFAIFVGALVLANMSKAVCSNELLEDARRAIAAAKQVRNNGNQNEENARKLNQQGKERRKPNAKS